MPVNRILLAGAAALALAGPVSAQTATRGLSATDQAFVRQANDGSAAEIATGRLASEKGGTSVKMFGRWMASAHGFAGRELASVVQRMHGQVVAPQLSPEAEAMVTKLQGLDGGDFDRAYLQGMVQDHEKDLQAFQQTAHNAQDPLVRNFAQNMVPVIQEHLQQARDLLQDRFNIGSEGQGRAADRTVQGLAGSLQTPTTR